MRRPLGLFILALSMLTLVATDAPATGSAEAGPVACAETITTTISAGGSSTTTPVGSPSSSPGNPCWIDVQPYPFGSEGTPVESSKCAREADGSDPPSCYLTVTSLAFRSWNRGLAATAQASADPQVAAKNAFGVWIFNGTHWFPDPTFPGHNTCPGSTVAWAGKLDYWLVGGPSSSGKWAPLCRFDGELHEWEPLEVPPATLAHVTPPPTPEVPNPRPKEGTITAVACLARDDCWFFGTYGTVVHWNGKALSDASPDTSQGWLQGEYTGAVARLDPAGNPFGVAVGATSERAATQGPLPAQPDGAPPPQMYTSSEAAFTPVAFSPPTTPQPGDPYRTDLVAVDFDSAGQGWVAGNPAGLSARFRSPAEAVDPPSPPAFRPFNPPRSAQPSPLVPVTPTGRATLCSGPPETTFTYSPFSDPAGAILWSSVAVLPDTGEALAGGRARLPTAEGEPAEPVIAQSGCEGASTVTRFRTADPTFTGVGPIPTVPADRKGTVTAAAANATNDAWAATTAGTLPRPSNSGFPINERPHLYRLTDGQPPAAREGDDNEFPPLELQLDPTIFVPEAPEPPAPQPPPTVVTQTHSETLPPALYGLKAKIHSNKRHGHLYLSLYLTFKLRRPVTIGAHALRHGRVVSVARPRLFSGGSGLLILTLDRRHWPTKIEFVA
jgi:hypothetical protein